MNTYSFILFVYFKSNGLTSTKENKGQRSPLSFIEYAEGIKPQIMPLGNPSIWNVHPSLYFKGVGRTIQLISHCFGTVRQRSSIRWHLPHLPSTSLQVYDELLTRTSPLPRNLHLAELQIAKDCQSVQVTADKTGNVPAGKFRDSILILILLHLQLTC